MSSLAFGFTTLSDPSETIYRNCWAVRWAEYNEEAATDASRRMREFLNRHLN